MHPVIEIILMHLGLAAVWYPPARRLLPEVHPAGAISLAYLLGATILLGCHHALNIAGLHSPAGAWLGFVVSWLLLMRLHRPAPRGMSASDRRECLGVSALTLFGLGLRLVDPLRHDSLAGGDSYLLLQYVYRFMENGVVFHEYIAGIPVLFGSLRIQATPFDVLHYGPALLASLGIPAFFSLGWALGGRKVAWLSAIGLAGCFGFLHVVSFNLVFVQFSTLCLALPWLIILTPEALRTGRARLGWILASVWMFLVLTGTYFALILASATAFWVIGVRAARKISTPAMLKGLLVLALVPGWIGFHYAVAAPFKNPQSGATFGNQVKEFEKIKSRQVLSQTPAAVVEPKTSSPALRSARLFAGPKRLDVFRPSMAESALVWMLTAAAIGLLRKPFSVPGLAGWFMVFAMVGTMTGMFEMPGYQGRYLYLLILLGLPVVARLLIQIVAPAMLRRRHGFPAPVRQLFRWKIICSGALAACLPSFWFPPVAGKSIPTAPELVVRSNPEDDVLTRLAFTSSGKSSLQMVFLFRPGENKFPGSAVAELNRKESVIGVEIERMVCASIAEPLPLGSPGQSVVLIMPRMLWDEAPPEVQARLLPKDPARIILMTPRTVAIHVDPNNQPEKP